MSSPRGGDGDRGEPAERLLRERGGRGAAARARARAGGRRGRTGAPLRRCVAVALADPCRASQLDEDTVSDLKWAFLATDLDHSGTLEPHELHTLLVVLGGNKPVEMHALMKIMEEAKVSPASRTRAP